MTLNDAYLISQIVAVVLVGPTLLYLALQVRQNTKQLQAAARYQFVEATGQMHSLTVGSKPTASMFRRGIESYAQLDPDERLQFGILIGHFLQIYSVMFELHADGLLPKSQWHAVLKDLEFILDCDGGREIWESFGKVGLAPDFVAFADAIFREKPGSYKL
ncbi:MAG: hypothetical protein ACJA0K_000616 [Maricaulis maris]|jgi:hypothetical protein|uniref:Uncharacterized protein n=1 Tax=Maricaulis maris (strain MCS10) TaxID=394221 RepID=Q0ALW0_MARMM|nr:hypothetical protein [Maricaulis maris]ABI66733.1 hypothetical protein Mmar10_2441 [Maricaulis maris MCS10]